MSQEEIYLDHHATAPLDERVLAAMLSFAQAGLGNPASPHASGRRALEALEEARREVAALLRCGTGEIVFTSGATEASNLALLGAASADPGARLVSTQIEHPSILQPLQALKDRGHDVVLLAVDRDGRVDPADLQSALTRRTSLVSVALANGEVGSIESVAELAAIAHEHGAHFHTDATQAALTHSVDITRLGVDFASLSAHKIHGPQGVGALFARAASRQALALTRWGGGQELGLRPGTPNVMGAVGFGVAAELVERHRGEDARETRNLRDRLFAVLAEELDVALNGPTEPRLTNNLNIWIPHVDADALIASTPGVDFSSGSACSSGVPGPSHVLRALGLDEARAEQSVRIGLGRHTTLQQIDSAAERIVQAATRLRATSKVIA